MVLDFRSGRIELESEMIKLVIDARVEVFDVWRGDMTLISIGVSEG